MKRITSIILALAMLFTVLSGCSSSTSTDTASTSTTTTTESTTTTTTTDVVAEAEAMVEAGVTTESTIDKDTIVIAVSTEPSNLSTTGHHSFASDRVNRLNYEGLTRLTSDMELVPCLAESWEVIDDVEWFFYLREGVVFHNGETMDADDVVASLVDAISSPYVDGLTLTYCTTIEAVDEYTVRIVTEEPTSMLLADLSNHANPILPASLIESGNDFNANPVGTGPYKFASWDLGNCIYYEAHEEYWDGEPAIKYLEYRVLPEGSSRTIALQAGDVDVVYDVQTSDMDILLADENIEVNFTAGTTCYSLYLNHDVEPFNDVNFRRALNAAINKEDVLEVTIDGLGNAMSSVISSVHPDAYSTVNADGWDLTLAQEYLDAWGGDPTSVSFDLMCSSETAQRSGEVIQAYLSMLGITVNITTPDTATWLANLSAGTYEATVCGMGDSNPIAQALIQVYGSGDESNNLNYVNLEVDALIDAAVAATDTEEYNALCQELSALLNAEYPMIPLYEANVIDATRTYVTGMNVNANGHGYWADIDFNR